MQFSNSVPWSDLKCFNLKPLILWTFLAKVTNSSNVSSLIWRKITQLYLEKSSAITNIYLLSYLLWTRIGPHKSMWINLSGLCVLTIFFWFEQESHLFSFCTRITNTMAVNIIVGNLTTESFPFSLFSKDKLAWPQCLCNNDVSYFYIGFSCIYITFQDHCSS